MDIQGAKALKERLGEDATDEALPLLEAVHADAPPLYHWFGVHRETPETVSPEADDDAPARSASFLRRLGLSFR